MFMLDGGIFLCKLSRRFGHQFSQSDCFYCYQLLSLEHTHSPFAPRLFSESTKDMILQVFQQNNQPAATCHSNASGGGVGGFFTMGAGSIVRGETGVNSSAYITPRLPCKILADLRLSHTHTKKFNCQQLQ